MKTHKKLKDEFTKRDPKKTTKVKAKKIKKLDIHKKEFKHDIYKYLEEE